MRNERFQVGSIGRLEVGGSVITEPHDVANSLVSSIDYNVSSLHYSPDFRRLKYT